MVFSVDLLTTRERQLVTRLFQGLYDRLDGLEAYEQNNAFQVWKDFTEKMRKSNYEADQKRKLLNVFQTSVRGERTTMEKDIIKKYIQQYMTCIPYKSITYSEMDQLCNEIDWFPYVGRSILFLQGDFGNVYYMVAGGRVGLYLEPSKDREMSIAREFGDLRSIPFEGTDQDLEKLGNKILTLSRGAGFGEYAILATTNKIRSCAAAAIDDDSILLILHADTYNAVLRQHHYRQKQLSSATAMLAKLPLFKHHIHSKIAAIAYTLTSQTYSSGKIIVRYNDPINYVLLIASGEVKVYAPTEKELENENSGKNNNNGPTIGTKFSTAPAHDVSNVLSKRIPRLAVSLLGKGYLIGETEFYQNKKTFQMTYETNSINTEILFMPINVFKESILVGDFRNSFAFKTIEMISDEREDRIKKNIVKSREIMHKKMKGETDKINDRENLIKILPSIIDSSLPTAPNRLYSLDSSIAAVKHQTIQALTNNNTNIDPEYGIKVTRKATYSVNPSEYLDSNKPNPPNKTLKKSVNFQSPRKSIFSK